METKNKSTSLIIVLVVIVLVLAGIAIFEHSRSAGSAQSGLTTTSSQTTASTTAPGSGFTMTVSTGTGTTTIYENNDHSFQMNIANGWAGAASVVQPGATIFSNANEDISNGVIVVAPIMYATGQQDAPTNSQTQQAIAALLKSQLQSQDLTISASDLTTAPFFYEYTKAAGVDDQGTSVHAKVYLFFGKVAYYVVAAEASEDNWSANSAVLASMATSFKPLK